MTTLRKLFETPTWVAIGRDDGKAYLTLSPKSFSNVANYRRASALCSSVNALIVTDGICDYEVVAIDCPESSVSYKRFLVTNSKSNCRWCVDVAEQTVMRWDIDFLEKRNVLSINISVDGREVTEDEADARKVASGAWLYELGKQGGGEQDER